MKSYLRVSCDKRNLAHIRKYVRKRLRECKVNGGDSEQIVLAVDEACANCMIHQHNCSIGASIEVTIYKEANVLFAEIRDTGHAFRIDTYKPRGLHEIVQKRAKGGLGIHLIHKIMDIIKVEEKADFFVYKLGKRIESAPNHKVPTSFPLK